jgi:hypothetical protein
MSSLAYLLAASHSGSTLLAMLLGAHPQACSVGELKATSLGDPDQYRCSCRRLIRECDFWAKVRSAMADEGVADFEITNAGTSIFEVQSRYAQRLLRPLYRGGLLETVRDSALTFSPAWRRHLAETQKRNAALIRALHSITRARVVIDSSKVALRLKYLLRVANLDLKVIRVIRDGRAVALTYTNEWAYADASDPTLRGGGAGVKRPTARQNMHDAAMEWRRSNEASDALLQTLPRNRWIEVRYEELCADPRATLSKICDFLGLDPNRINLDFRSKEHHVIGNGMRMDSTSEIRLDTRWKTDLSKEDLRAFDEVAGDLNRKYGYV